MKLTESKLKQLINEEYEAILFENSLKSELPPIQINDLIPKAQKMKDTIGEEDLIQEGGGLLIFAAVLAFPRILQWMGKAAKAILSQKKVFNYIANKIGVVGTLQVDQMIQLLTGNLGIVTGKR